MFQAEIHRKKMKEVRIGTVKIGADNPIAIQSMTNTDTRDSKSTIYQINALEEAGCEIVRVAVLDMEAAEKIKEIKKGISIPLVADIHFDYRLALKSIENGIDKLRINPGNIGDVERIKKVVHAAKERDIPIRVGVNSGSLEREFTDKFGGVTPLALVESALKHVKIIEQMDYDNIVVSIKASNVPLCIDAYAQMAEKANYPLHLGITEAGSIYAGAMKSAVGIGAILSRGIGDTIRVSLTGDPLEEIKCAKEILKSLKLRKFGVEFISCPTCGRTELDMISIANLVEQYCMKVNKDITVAVMGCAVNGPGEAREADVGVACGKDGGLIFKKGEVLKKVHANQIVDELKKEIDML